VFQGSELEFGVGVRTDFAIQVNFFMLRGNPFHRRLSFSSRGGRDDKNKIAQAEEEGNSHVTAGLAQSHNSTFRRLRAKNGGTLHGKNTVRDGTPIYRQQTVANSHPVVVGFRVPTIR